MNSSPAPRLANPRLAIRFAFVSLVATTLAATIGCGGSPGTNTAPTRLVQTQMSATANPLVAQYAVTTSGAASVMVQFGTTTNYGLETSAQQISSRGGTVNMLVAGMKQNTLYHMRAVVTTSEGQILDQDQTFQTGAIPAGLVPAMQVTIPPGQQPSSGTQLISGASFEFAITPSGDVVWYYINKPGDAPYLIKLMPNGHMLMVLNYPGPPASSGVREVDLAGNTIRELDLPTLSQNLKDAGYNLNVASIDHDVLLLPNNHLILIVTDSRVFNNLPGYPGQTTVLGDAVVDVDQNNRPAWVWDAFDHLDINRHPIYFPDWIHANALFYVPDDGSLLLSMRHQHWVIKIDYRNGSGPGDIIWRLGYQGDFTLLNSDSPSDWFYAQHDANISSPNLTGVFQLALFDNGNYRVLDDSGDTCNPTGQPACYSTAALFQVDEVNKTAQRMWTFQSPFSSWGGTVELLPNSNIYVNETAPSDFNGSRALELTQQTNPTDVWEMLVSPNAYRTMHLPSLYPGVQW